MSKEINIAVIIYEILQKKDWLSKKGVHEVAINEYCEVPISVISNRLIELNKKGFLVTKRVCKRSNALAYSISNELKDISKEDFLKNFPTMKQREGNWVSNIEDTLRFKVIEYLVFLNGCFSTNSICAHFAHKNSDVNLGTLRSVVNRLYRSNLIVIHEYAISDKGITAPLYKANEEKLEEEYKKCIDERNFHKAEDEFRSPKSGIMARSIIRECSFSSRQLCHLQTLTERELLSLRRLLLSKIDDVDKSIKIVLSNFRKREKERIKNLLKEESNKKKTAAKEPAKKMQYLQEDHNLKLIEEAEKRGARLIIFGDAKGCVKYKASCDAIGSGSMLATTKSSLG